MRFLTDFYLVNPGYCKLLKIASFWYVLAHWMERRGGSSGISNYKQLGGLWELFTKISKAVCSLKKKKIPPGNFDNLPAENHWSEPLKTQDYLVLPDSVVPNQGWLPSVPLLKWHSAKSGGSFGCHNVEMGEVLLASVGRAEMPLNIPQCPGEQPTVGNPPTLNVGGATVKKPWIKPSTRLYA